MKKIDEFRGFSKNKENKVLREAHIKIGRDLTSLPFSQDWKLLYTNVS